MAKELDFNSTPTEPVDITDAIVVAEYAPIMSLDDSRKAFEEFKSFVQGQLIAKVDYAIIPGSDKPSLLKPGAEKLAFFVGLTLGEGSPAKIQERFDEDFVSYGYKVEVYKGNRRIGASEGYANSDEQGYWQDRPRAFANTISKMAQKRAYVSAVLMATRASEVFTCDLDDMSEEQLNKMRLGQSAKTLPPASKTARSADSTVWICQAEGCKSKVTGYTSKTGKVYTTEQIVQWSRKDCNGLVLCYKHKNAYKNDPDSIAIKTMDTVMEDDMAALGDADAPIDPNDPFGNE